MKNISRQINFSEIPNQLIEYQGEISNSKFYSLIIAEEVNRNLSTVYWIDCGDTSNLDNLTDLMPPEHLDRIKISRAYNETQHYSACKKIEDKLSESASMIILSNIDLHYDRGSEKIFLQMINTLKKLSEENNIKIIFNLAKNSCLVSVKRLKTVKTDSAIKVFLGTSKISEIHLKNEKQSKISEWSERVIEKEVKN